MLPGDEQCTEIANKWRKVIVYLENQKEQKPAECGNTSITTKTVSTEEKEECINIYGGDIITATTDYDDQLIGFIFDLLNSLTWRKDWAMSKEECLERLKSLRPPQYCENCKLKRSVEGWKPSEEQMKALNALNCNGGISYAGQQNELISLYNDLKKLKK